jgi:hypothetical protein
MTAPARPLPDQFLVAFSLAGEQRTLVRAIAQAVESRLGSGSVFLDEWFEHYVAGADADLKLQDIYLKKSALAVLCVSEHYGGKPWTQAEYEAIRARLMQARASPNERDREAILPIRVGDGEVPGILFNAIVPDVRARTAAETADLICARLGLVVPETGAGAAVATVRAAPVAGPALASPRVASLRKALEQLHRQYDAAVQQSVNAIDAAARVQAEQQAELIEQRMQELECKLPGRP